MSPISTAGHKAARRIPWGAMIAVFLLALFVRLPDLSRRPFHMDEAGNAYLISGMLAGESFRYRVQDHHGPTLFQLGASVLGAGGVKNLAAMEAWMLRAITAVAGALLAAAMVSFAPVLGRGAAVIAGVLVALSAPFVYYSGIFIHETLLLLLFAAWLRIFWDWRERGGAVRAVAWGLLAGLMAGTKETSGPILALAVIALLPGTRISWRTVLSGALVAAASALAMIAVIFSNGFREPAHALDLFRAISPQVTRGLGQDHRQPWFQYLEWFMAPSPVGFPWSGWFLVAFAVAGLWLARNHAFVIRLGCLSMLLAVFFFWLPYKTPWLILAVVLPLILVAGAGCAELARRTPRILSAALALLAACLLLGETWSRCVEHSVDPRNPLAYSPASPDVERLAARVAELGAGRTDFTVQVLADDYWPLPWVLRKFSAGYWTAPPQEWRPGVVIVGPEFAGAASQFAPFDLFEIRPGVRVFLANVP